MAPQLAPRVASVAVLRPFVVRVTFADGEVRDIDLEPVLDGPVFAPLRDPNMFRKVRINESATTIEWPNGADLDPEVMYGLEESASKPHAIITIPQRA